MNLRRWIAGAPQIFGAGIPANMARKLLSAGHVLAAGCYLGQGGCSAFRISGVLRGFRLHTGRAFHDTGRLIDDDVLPDVVVWHDHLKSVLRPDVGAEYG